MSRLFVETRSVSGPLSGDYTRQETRVPIPNTTVKLPGPMIVPTSAKVGYRRDFSTRLESPQGGSGVFFVPSLSPGLGGSGFARSPPQGLRCSLRANLPRPQRLVRVARAVPHNGVIARYWTVPVHGFRPTTPTTPSSSSRPFLTARPIRFSLRGTESAAPDSGPRTLRTHPAAGPAIPPPVSGNRKRVAKAGAATEGTQRLELLRTVVRRFRLTGAGIPALNQLPPWLDQGHSDSPGVPCGCSAEPTFQGGDTIFSTQARLRRPSQRASAPSAGDPGITRLGNLSRPQLVDWPFPFGPARPTKWSMPPPRTW
ncbi:MAG: hypothetical protein CM1200mP2_46780 [Planctomycetaceae bacterium]|nr:MAG: hypothetical protein CM1200mP2_46780 [Planctomycetaceae bacterium]